MTKYGYTIKLRCKWLMRCGEAAFPLWSRYEDSAGQLHASAKQCGTCTFLIGVISLSFVRCFLWIRPNVYVCIYTHTHTCAANQINTIQWRACWQQNKECELWRCSAFTFLRWMPTRLKIILKPALGDVRTVKPLSFRGRLSEADIRCQRQMVNQTPFILAVCQSLKKYLASPVSYQEAVMTEMWGNFSRAMKMPMKREQQGRN